MMGNRISFSSQYDDMNNGPHERPFIPIGAPSLTYHAAFWFSDPTKEAAIEKLQLHAKTSRTEQECVPNRLTHTESVYAYFNRVQTQIEASNDGFRESIKALTEVDHHRIRTWTVHYVHAHTAEKLTVTAECHTEYWRISVILTFGESESAVCPKAQRIFDAISELENDDPIPKEILKTARQALVDDYEHFVMNSVLPCETDQDACWVMAKECFGTFIGSIFWKPENPGERQQHELTARHIWEESHFAHPRSLIRQIWPIVENLQIDPEKPYQRNFEVTASLFLKDRAIYASSLGHPRTPPAAITRKVPVVYSLFVCSHDPWQLSRLLDTIHSMGTLRLAALRDIEKISLASTELAEIRSSLRRGDEIESIYSRMEALLRKDVSWRIERSMRYWTQFKSRIERLRIGRIEGFQPYDAFVERRIGDTMAFIESTGKQLSYVRKEVDLRYQVKQTESLKESGNHIVDLQKAAEFLAVIPLTYYSYMLIEKCYGPNYYALVFVLIGWLSIIWSRDIKREKENSRNSKSAS